MNTKKNNIQPITSPALTQAGFLAKLKTKWGLTSLFQVLAILAAFSFAGSTVVLIRPLFFAWLGFTSQTPFWIKTVTYVLFFVPSYQLLLLSYGFLLGQFPFFWQKEQRLVRKIASLFS